jgi:hypothetical protein
VIDADLDHDHLSAPIAGEVAVVYIEVMQPLVKEWTPIRVEVVA